MVYVNRYVCNTSIQTLANGIRGSGHGRNKQHNRLKFRPWNGQPSLSQLYHLTLANDISRLCHRIHVGGPQYLGSSTPAPYLPLHPNLECGIILHNNDRAPRHGRQQTTPLLRLPGIPKLLWLGNLHGSYCRNPSSMFWNVLLRCART